jgi:hypothetical protein
MILVTYSPKMFVIIKCINAHKHNVENERKQEAVNKQQQDTDIKNVDYVQKQGAGNKQQQYVGNEQHWNDCNAHRQKVSNELKHGPGNLKNQDESKGCMQHRQTERERFLHDSARTSMEIGCPHTLLIQTDHGVDMEVLGAPKINLNLGRITYYRNKINKKYIK